MCVCVCLRALLLGRRKFLPNVKYQQAFIIYIEIASVTLFSYCSLAVHCFVLFAFKGQFQFFPSFCSFLLTSDEQPDDVVYCRLAPHIFHKILTPHISSPALNHSDRLADNERRTTTTTTKKTHTPYTDSKPKNGSTANMKQLSFLVFQMLCNHLNENQLALDG